MSKKSKKAEKVLEEAIATLHLAENIHVTDIELGERYRDELSGVEGTATAVAFFLHGCERVDLEVIVNGELKIYAFDAPRLRLVAEPEKEITTRGTGGPTTVRSSTLSHRGGRPDPSRRGVRA